MPEKKRRNPFEDHIESELFDVSKLESMAPILDAISLEIQSFLDELPESLDTESWDDLLDDRQNLIYKNIVTSDRVCDIMRECYEDDLDSMSDAQIKKLLMMPVLLGMLMEEKLHPTQPVSEPAPTMPSTTSDADPHPLMDIDDPSVNDAQWGMLMSRIFTNIKNVFSRVRQRY